ncbi:MAG: pyridoxamine 5'-phosphate oxidase family protein [Candidatus Limnocylindrales bacterium]
MAQSDLTVVPDLLERARRYLSEDLHFATVATVGPDGAPLQAVSWYLLEGDALVLNSAAGRAWPANLQRDPRVSVIVDHDYDWLSIRGVVTIDERPDVAQGHIAAMARHYHADEPERAERMIRDGFEREHRISFRIGLAASRLYFGH